MNLTGDGPAERLNGQFVSQEFFPLVGVKPLLGRVFAPENYRRGAPMTVIISHGLWQRRFGGDHSIINRTITLESIPVEIIGVMPPGFHFVWPKTDFWAPLLVNRNRDYRANPGNALNVVGRLNPSIATAVAQKEMRAISDALAQQHSSNRNVSARVVPLRDELTGDVKASLWILFAAVGVLLLIACSNFAGLLLARSVYRLQEMTVRVAVGAGRAAIVRQSLAESLMLALAGGTAGVIVARSAVDGMMALAPPDMMQITHGNARLLSHPRHSDRARARFQH
jgi:ABC-type antimicrobial peptide transport system permease subunit